MALSGELLPAIMRPAQSRFGKMQHSNSGPPNAAGPPQRVRSDAGYWTANYQSISLRGTKLLQWQAFEARVAVNPSLVWLVSPRQCWHTPRRLADVAAASETVSHSDGSSFSDGTLYAPSEPDFTIETAAELRDTQIDIRGINALSLRAGQYFTIWTEEGPRLYLIGGVYATDDEDVQTVKFWPPLRADVLTTDTISTEEPVCPMVVMSGADGLSVEASGRSATPSLEFAECPW